MTNVRMTSNTEAITTPTFRSLKPLKADPLHDEARSTRFSAIKAVGKYAKMLAAGVTAVAVAVTLSVCLSGCAQEPSPFMQSDNVPLEKDSAGDVDTDSDTDSDTDADTDSDSDSDTDTDTDADMDSDTDSDTDADMDSDSDSDTDTDTDADMDSDSDSDTDTDTDADTETGSDTVVVEYDDLEFTSSTSTASFTVTPATSLVCNLLVDDHLTISTTDGEFEVAGLNAFSSFDPPTRTGQAIHFVRANDPGATGSDCTWVGMATEDGALVLLEADDGFIYAFELANTTSGYLGINYTYDGRDFHVGVYDHNGMGYPTSSTTDDEIWVVGPAGEYLGDPVDEGFGMAAVLEGGNIVMKSATSSMTTGEGFYRYNYTEDVDDGEILDVPASGFPGDSVSITVGATTPGGVVYEDGTVTFTSLWVPNI